MLRHTILAAAALTLAGGAVAQAPRSTAPEPRPQSTPTFSSYDADRNGHITREEASTNITLVGRFERLDRDQNEALDEAEFARFEAELDPGAPASTPPH